MFCCFLEGTLHLTGNFHTKYTLSALLLTLLNQQTHTFRLEVKNKSQIFYLLFNNLNKDLSEMIKIHLTKKTKPLTRPLNFVGPLIF